MKIRPWAAALVVDAPLDRSDAAPLLDQRALPAAAMEEGTFPRVALDAHNDAMVTAARALWPLTMLRSFIQ